MDIWAGASVVDPLLSRCARAGSLPPLCPGAPCQAGGAPCQAGGAPCQAGERPAPPSSLILTYNGHIHQARHRAQPALIRRPSGFARR
jgi:hypothetical protein